MAFLYETCELLVESKNYSDDWHDSVITTLSEAEKSCSRLSVKGVKNSLTAAKNNNVRLSYSFSCDKKSISSFINSVKSKLGLTTTSSYKAKEDALLSKDTLKAAGKAAAYSALFGPAGGVIANSSGSTKKGMFLHTFQDRSNKSFSKMSKDGKHIISFLAQTNKGEYTGNWELYLFNATEDNLKKLGFKN